jgi:hypothetical protein
MEEEMNLEWRLCSDAPITTSRHYEERSRDRSEFYHTKPRLAGDLAQHLPTIFIKVHRTLSLTWSDILVVSTGIHSRLLVMVTNLAT